MKTENHLFFVFIVFFILYSFSVSIELILFSNSFNFDSSSEIKIMHNRKATNLFFHRSMLVFQEMYSQRCAAFELLVGWSS